MAPANETPATASDARAIGGFFEPDTGGGNGLPHLGAMRFQSARAGYEWFLRARSVRLVWMPWFLCGCIGAATRAAGAGIRYYPVDEAGLPLNRPTLGDDDLLLAVNYFGIRGNSVDSLRSEYGGECVIVDNSQALYERPADAAATLYSPRKFFGLPDGGVLVAQRLTPPAEQDDRSSERLAALRLRRDFGPEAGWPAYKAAESSLEDLPARRMSELTSEMLQCVDAGTAARKRQRNYDLLHRALEGRNRYPAARQSAAVPLCYPLLCEDVRARERLIAARIFVPRYWPDIPVDAPAFERDLALRLLPLPCDQRWGDADMARVVEALR